MCMLHHGVAAGLLKSISPTTQELEDVDLRVLPSCVSRKQHVVYKTSHVNVVLFTSWFSFSFLSIPGREICSSGFVTSSSIKRLFVWFSCLRVFKLLSLCVRACVLGWGGGKEWSLRAGLLDHIPSNWFGPCRPPATTTAPLAKNDFELCFYLLSPPVTYLVLK